MGSTVDASISILPTVDGLAQHVSVCRVVLSADDAQRMCGTERNATSFQICLLVTESEDGIRSSVLSSGRTEAYEYSKPLEASTLFALCLKGTAVLYGDVRHCPQARASPQEGRFSNVRCEERAFSLQHDLQYRTLESHRRKSQRERKRCSIQTDAPFFNLVMLHFGGEIHHLDLWIWTGIFQHAA